MYRIFFLSMFAIIFGMMKSNAQCSGAGTYQNSTTVQNIQNAGGGPNNSFSHAIGSNDFLTLSYPQLEAGSSICVTLSFYTPNGKAIFKLGNETMTISNPTRLGYFSPQEICIPVMTTGMQTLTITPDNGSFIYVDGSTYSSCTICPLGMVDQNRDGVCEKMAGNSGAKGDFKLQEFTVCSINEINQISQNLSALTYCDARNLLYGVNKTNLYEFSVDGTLRRSLTLSGFQDPEAIVYIDGDQFAIAEEQDRSIVFVTIPQSQSSSITHPGDASTISLIGTITPHENPNKNDGLEGLAYDKENDQLYIIKEKNDPTIYRIDNPLSKIGASISPIRPFDIASKVFSYPATGRFSDLSGLAYSKDHNSLLVLSQEGSAIAEIDPSTGRLKSFFVFTNPLPQQVEGITIIDDNHIVIAGEPNEIIIAKRVGGICDRGSNCSMSVYDTSCNCVEMPGADTDGDGICDAEDDCPNFDKDLIGQPCDDQDACTSGETYLADCTCGGGTLACTKIPIKVLLEGFYNIETGTMHTTLRDKNLLPTQQPFNKAPWNYNGPEQYQNTATEIVDWVLVIVRDAAGTILEQQAALVDTEGNLREVMGTEGLELTTAIGNYISVHHTAHIAVITTNPYTAGVLDFTINTEDNQLKLTDNRYVLYAGDYDSSGVINSLDFNLWTMQGAAINQYLSIDGDGNGIINNLDYNIWNSNRSKVGHESIRY